MNWEEEGGKVEAVFFFYQGVSFVIFIYLLLPFAMGSSVLKYDI